MSKIFTANRVAAIATWLTGLGGLTAGGLGLFPHAWQNGAVAVAGLLTKLATAVTFLLGSQRSEAVQANASYYRTYQEPTIPAPALYPADEFSSVPSEDEVS